MRPSCPHPAGTICVWLVSGLEEGPPPGAMDSPAGAEFAELYHGIVGDRRRYTRAYCVGATAARRAVEEDEAARDLRGWPVPSDDAVPSARPLTSARSP